MNNDEFVDDEHEQKESVRGDFKRYIDYKRQEMIKGEKCLDCFLAKSCCVCGKVREIYQSAFRVNFNTRIELYMHYKEWGRSSNTGKLMQVGMPSCCTTSIYGLPEDQQRLSESLTKGPTLILYPRSDARPISEYSAWFREAVGRVNLVVIDSTWPQSHAMDKSLPAHVPRVKIDEMILGPSEFLNRKQSKNKSKVSTLEAVVMALKALGFHSAEQLDAFTESLRYGVDAMLRQGGKPPAYGNIIIPKASGYTGPYNISTVEKPTTCLICHATKDMGVNFRNVGVRKRLMSAQQEALHDDGVHLVTDCRYASNTADHSDVQDTSDSGKGKAQDPKDASQDAPGSDELMVSYRVWKCSSCKQYFSPSTLDVKSI
eukprot:gene33967-41104_t